ncbi:MAG: AadS family aminoglycoside 6-adenylyltransferase [Pedobacter sp.]|uniref:AadS family aminoglycoside 6-adenylyltransferase n=1 Tax=Pedobacter sp. TaxID=1411316 RepID=UPI003562A5D9
MENKRQTDLRKEKLETIIDWSKSNKDIRTVLLTSSLVNPLAPIDEYSDLDIELVFEDNAKYISSKDWIHLFGNPIAMIEENESSFDDKHAMKMVLYDDYIKVDFKLYSVPNFLQQVDQNELCEDWDIGYKVLIDKDDITKNMKEATHQVSIIKKPTEQKFKQLLNDFWWDTTYVAKCLARDEIFYAKFMMESNIRTDYIIPLIEWHIANQHDWNITTNKYGRLFKKYLTSEIWEKIERTFSGKNINENWNALFAMADLVSEIGTDLSEKLGYEYPFKLETDIRKYLNATFIRT